MAVAIVARARRYPGSMSVVVGTVPGASRSGLSSIQIVRRLRFGKPHWRIVRDDGQNGLVVHRTTCGCHFVRARLGSLK